MCFPKIGEDLDEEDEVSDRAGKLTNESDRIDEASDEAE
jgi:hypothetical protein